MKQHDTANREKPVTEQAVPPPRVAERDHRRDDVLRRLPMIERAWFWIGKQSGSDAHLYALPHEFTCHDCAAEPTCPSAWDFYNTDGDCLEAK